MYAFARRKRSVYWVALLSLDFLALSIRLCFPHACVTTKQWPTHEYVSIRLVSLEDLAFGEWVRLVH